MNLLITGFPPGRGSVGIESLLTIGFPPGKRSHIPYHAHNLAKYMYIPNQKHANETKKKFAVVVWL